MATQGEPRPDETALPPFPSLSEGRALIATADKIKEGYRFVEALVKSPEASIADTTELYLDLAAELGDPGGSDDRSDRAAGTLASFLHSDLAAVGFNKARFDQLEELYGQGNVFVGLRLKDSDQEVVEAGIDFVPTPVRPLTLAFFAIKGASEE